MKLDEAYALPPWTAEEIVTRCLVRKDFTETFGAREVMPDMQGLERVLFDIIYPCPDG